MKHLCIVSAGTLPIPAVEGGAVESLVDYIINQNEVENKIRVTVISIYNEAAVKVAGSYENCRFEFIKINKHHDKIYRLVARLVNKILNRRLNLNQLYATKVCKTLSNRSFDQIIIENRAEYVLPIKKITKAQILLHIHNDYLNSETDNGKHIMHNCDKVVTVSEYIKKRVLTLDSQYTNKVHVLKNCTDITLFDKKKHADFRTSYRHNANISKDQIVVLFSGRIHPNKGIKELISAFKNIRNTECILLVVGSSWYGSNKKTEFEKEINSLSRDIQQRIIFTGFVPFSDMPKIISVADIAVVPSIWEEPAGLVVIEAMSSGLPTIVTDSGGIPEYINEECVIMLKRDEKLIDNLTISIEELIFDKSKRESLGKAARKHALRYNVQQYYQDYLELIENNAE